MAKVDGKIEYPETSVALKNQHLKSRKTDELGIQY